MAKKSQKTLCYQHNLMIYKYIYIYICVCVCVCVYEVISKKTPKVELPMSSEPTTDTSKFFQFLATKHYFDINTRIANAFSLVINENLCTSLSLLLHKSSDGDLGDMTFAFEPFRQ